MVGLLVGVALLGGAARALAAPPRLAGGIQVAGPATLDVGAGFGFGLSADRLLSRSAIGGMLALGVDGQWTAATEHSDSWEVRHDALQLLVAADLGWQLGGGVLALRLGVGGVAIREERLRHQSGRLPGGAQIEGAWGLRPVASLQLAAALALVGPVGARLRLGPRLEWGPTRGFAPGMALAVEATWQP